MGLRRLGYRWVGEDRDVGGCEKTGMGVGRYGCWCV